MARPHLRHRPPASSELRISCEGGDLIPTLWVIAVLLATAMAWTVVIRAIVG